MGCLIGVGFTLKVRVHLNYSLQSYMFQCRGSQRDGPENVTSRISFNCLIETRECLHRFI